MDGRVDMEFDGWGGDELEGVGVGMCGGVEASGTRVSERGRAP